MNKTADKVIWQSVCYVPIRIDPPLEFNIPNIWIRHRSYFGQCVFVGYLRCRYCLCFSKSAKAWRKTPTNYGKLWNSLVCVHCFSPFTLHWCMWNLSKCSCFQQRIYVSCEKLVLYAWNLPFKDYNSPTCRVIKITDS